MRKGTKHSPEAIEKQKKSHKGAVAWNKGLKGESYKAHYPKGFGGTFEKGLTPWITGKKHSEETRAKISKIQTGRPALWQRGEKSHRWKGGTTPELVLLRSQTEYKQWRKLVFERDKYTCQDCGQVGGKLNADHIMPFALFPELRYEISNGRTLCVPCHMKTDTFGGRARSKFKV